MLSYLCSALLCITILACSEVVDDVVASVRRLQGLCCYEDDVHQVADEEEAEGRELEQTHRRVAEVEPAHQPIRDQYW